MTDVKIESHVIEFDYWQKQFIHDRVQVVLDSGKVVLGPYTEEFEAAYAAACGRKYGVAVSSDTAAFEIQLKIAGVEGCEVLFPALGFGSILESIRNAGGTPRFIDASLEGHLFATADEVQKALEVVEDGSIAAVILMHTGGLLARDGARILAIVDEYGAGIPVLEDAAHCFGSELDGVKAGTWGWSSAFSLYATKPMHAMEGGMIVTDDADLAAIAKQFRNYGRVADFGRSRIEYRGNSWRMTELQAIVGLANLEVFPENLGKRRRVMQTYDAMLTERLDGSYEPWQWLPYAPGMSPNGYRYILMVPPSGSGDVDLERKNRIKLLMRQEFGVDLPGEVYELPAHLQPAWIDLYNPRREISMPVAEDFCRRHFALPCYGKLTEHDQEYVVDSFVKVYSTVMGG